MYPYIHLFGNVTLPTYGLLLMCAVVLGIILALKRSARYHVKRDDVIYAACYIGAGAIIGSKLLYMLTMMPWIVENFALIQSNPQQFWLTALGGLVYYGGFIGGVAGLLLYSRQYKVDKWALLNAIIPALPLMHAIGRVGCFMAGCCYGCPAEPPLGVIFAANSSAPQGVALLPVQLYEAGFNLVLCVALYIIGNRTHKKTAVLGTYLIAYGVERFVLEFFRYDAIRGVWGGLSTSQWISVILIPIGLYLILSKRFNQPMQLDAADPEAGHAQSEGEGSLPPQEDGSAPAQEPDAEHLSEDEPKE